MEKISVIVPAYNLEHEIVRCLDRLQQQTYPNLEIVVVDDGSADRTGAILDAYAKSHSGVTVIHQPNGGVTNARLRGVEEASGQWIGFVDGDDDAEPDMYQLLMDNAIKYEADISHCGYQMVFPSRVDLYHGTGVLRQQNRQQGLIDILSGGLVEPGLWNKLYRRELLLQMIRDDVLDRSIKINEDLLMNFYLFRYAEKSVFEDVCKYHYVLRMGSAATSKINEHKLYDPLRVSKILMDETSDDPALHAIVTERLLRILIGNAAMEIAENPQLLKPVRRQARQELRELVRSGAAKVCSRKMRVMSGWCALWPESYGLVHRIYAKMTGLDQIYEIK